MRSAPDLASIRRIERRGVHRLHRGVVLIGIVVDRLDLLGGLGDRGLGVAVLIADKGRLRVVETFFKPLCNLAPRKLVSPAECVGILVIY